MNPESSTQIDNEGNIIYLDENPIEAIYLSDKNDENTKNIIKYITQISTEINNLNKYNELSLVISKDLPYNKVACCIGKKAKLPSKNTN